MWMVTVAKLLHKCILHTTLSPESDKLQLITSNTGTVSACCVTLAYKLMYTKNLSRYNLEHTPKTNKNKKLRSAL